MPRIELHTRDWHLSLRPDLGGAISRLDHAGVAVLRPMAEGGCDIIDAASFPLVPYANRIADCRFAVNGRTHHLPRNFGDHPHCLHGLGWQNSWEVALSTPSRAVLVHRHDGSEGWPWRYRAEQHFQLSDEGLGAVLEITNDDAQSMPSGLGFHPYFQCSAGTRLQFAAVGVWHAGDTQLPTNRDRSDRLGDWTAGAPVAGETLIDNVYDGWDGSARIDHDDGRSFCLTASGASWLHLLRPPGEAGFFCAEPVSHGPDAINRGGMAMLAPGETQRLEMNIWLG